MGLQQSPFRRVVPLAVQIRFWGSARLILDERSATLKLKSTRRISCSIPG